MKNSKSLLLATTAISLLVTAYQNADGKPGWKLDADGKIEMKDGNPVYINSNGGEMTVGATKISELNAESKGHRERAEAAEAKLESFKGIDPVIAKKAIEDIKKIETKKLIDAGDVDKVKDEMKKEFQTQLSEKDNALKEITDKYNNSQISGIFTNSAFVRESVAVPFDMFEASFKNNFKVGEKGVIESFDKAGNRIMSKEKIGEYATPDEALKILVETHPQKDTILKANVGTGSGNQGNGGGHGGSKIVKRADFDKLLPAEQAATAKKASLGELSIVD